MSNEFLIRERIQDSIRTKALMAEDEEIISRVSSLADLISQCILSGGKLVVCGNGGSASDALHLAGEVVGRFIKERKGWPVVVLNADVATMTAVSNDYGFENVFARQVEAHLKAEDVFLGISTSGNSENVYRAVLKAREIGAKTACLSGRDGGRIGQIVDYSIVAPSDVTARIQECHITLIHILCEIIESNVSKEQENQ